MVFQKPLVAFNQNLYHYLVQSFTIISRCIRNIRRSIRSIRMIKGEAVQAIEIMLVQNYTYPSIPMVTKCLL